MKIYSVFLPLLMIAFMGYGQSNLPEAKPPVKIETVVKVKVFPNPATNVVNVLGLKNTYKAYISVSDIYGNTILTYQWAVRRNAVNIPISTLKTGAYIIYISSEEQQVRKKFYKQ